MFATVSYRLEPNGRGSRFPLIMNRLFAGWLAPSDALAAARELEEIEAGLVALPADRVVWSLSDLRRRDDRQLPVNHRAANARDYFVAADGRPLVTVLRDAVRSSHERNEPIGLASREGRLNNRVTWTVLIIGLLWTTIGYLFFPDWVFIVDDTSSTPKGFLVWPVGILIFGLGVVCLVRERYPKIAKRFGLPSFVVGLAIYLLLAWA
jgi:hypothetical protein